MRIMTSNMWGDFFNNPTALRKDMLYRIYRKYNPDVIGFQEAAAGWYDVDIFWKLGEEYNFVGTECCNHTNSTPIAVKKEYTVIAKGHEQLKDTPDWSKAITWSVIEKSGERFAVCNTHFWWMRGTEPDEVKKSMGVQDFTIEDHRQLRTSNSIQLSELMLYLHKKYACPVFAFGDMNGTVFEDFFIVYAKNSIENLYDVAEYKDNICTLHGDPKPGEDGSFHGERATKEYIKGCRKRWCLTEENIEDAHLTSIDHIVALGDNFKVKQYRVIEDEDALSATDHSPVYVDIEFV